jgi:hypothetical protein
MRLGKLVFVAAVLLFTGWISTSASVLEDKKNTWSFSLVASDVDQVGSFGEYSFRWTHVFKRGYHELGAFISAFSNDYDDPSIIDDNGSVIGPVYQWNWTPSKDWGSGFLFVAIGGVGGDTGDFFDSAASWGVGIRSIVGNSAAITAALQFEQFQGKDSVDDQDATSIVIGITLFSHNR